MNWALEATLITTCSTVGTFGSVGLVWATFMPQSRLWGRNLWHGQRTDPPQVAITFDDGPSPESTGPILDVLDDLRAPAAFFVIGQNAQRHPDVIRRIDSAGHLLGNHTYDHSHCGIFRSGRYWRQQLCRTDEVIFALTGKRPALFRPPIGFKTWYTARAASATRHHMVTWSRRGMDGVATTPQRILSRLVPCTQPGDIIALHDGQEPHAPLRPQASVKALRPLIVGLRDRGLKIVRLDELLDVAPYAPSPLQKVNIRPA